MPDVINALEGIATFLLIVALFVGAQLLINMFRAERNN